MEITLQTFGAKLRVKDGLFEVTVPDLSGANHHVVEQFAAHQVKTILLQKGTSVSADALLLALENDTEILVLDPLGHPTGRFWTLRPSTTIAVWKNQLAISLTPEATHIAREWIEAKIRERLQYLHKLKGYRQGDKRARIEQAESSITDLLSRLHAASAPPAKLPDVIRGHEGTTSRIYLDTLGYLLPDDYHYEGRSRRPAMDMFNAFLNYGYGILYGIVERALLLAGVHPYIGFFHDDGHKRRSMVFDFIEPFRIWVEKTVFQLFAAKAPGNQHLQPAPNSPGGLWLNESGIRLLKDALHLRLRQKKKEFNGRRFPLESYVAEEAKRFAARLLHWGKQPEAPVREQAFV